MALADNKALHLPLFRCATKRQVSFGELYRYTDKTRNETIPSGMAMKVALSCTKMITKDTYEH
ncbi:hypothetical protein HY00_03085 [Peptococcaceae bacterium SCADC1_2_3]|jgi:hypothetical protein|nr:hypothetical protein HY00_03085 [Peptococcaceae bacterium SCADC1_2_3]